MSVDIRYSRRDEQFEAWDGDRFITAANNRGDIVMDMHGRVTVNPAYDTKGMTSPVLCRFCGKVYDLTAATVIYRYADATVFKTPCCGEQADDREWKSLPDIRRLS